MLPKIKNCRKCGAFGTIEESTYYDTEMRAKRYYYVRCVGCDYKTCNCRTRTEAVKAWNEGQKMKACVNCRWQKYLMRRMYLCRDCIGLNSDAEYNFFCLPDSETLFGEAELCHCRKCGRKVHMEFGKHGYKYIRCLCGNSMQAKVTAEEMINRWNNRVPARSKIWKIKK